MLHFVFVLVERYILPSSPCMKIYKNKFIDKKKTIHGQGDNVMKGCCSHYKLD
jgi:hypothetical protein